MPQTPDAEFAHQVLALLKSPDVTLHKVWIHKGKVYGRLAVLTSPAQTSH